MSTSTEMSRRIDSARWTPAEHAITAAMRAVEAMAADVLLTQAVLLLEKARACVADYVDALPRVCEKDETACRAPHRVGDSAVYCSRAVGHEGIHVAHGRGGAGLVHWSRQ